MNMYENIKSNLKESASTMRDEVKEVVQNVFDGTDFMVSGVELLDGGVITFDVTAMGPAGEMDRTVELEVPELNYLDAVREACEDWMSEHDSPDSFYETEETMNEAIEQKYEKSNDHYNSFLRDVKRYTGSYEYLYGGKVNVDWEGTPIAVNYFYYNRPYANGGYNLVVNVLTPMGTSGGWIQDEIEKGFEDNSKTQLSNKEIKDKILEIVSSLE